MKHTIDNKNDLSYLDSKHNKKMLTTYLCITKHESNVQIVAVIIQNLDLKKGGGGT